ncbi:DUF1707 domain-containing protein [Arthrobacter crystallopoietes]|jgi:putative membrane protein|uniref:Short C-terminal domain-containing protein n=1 Tax=Crystallibacter crystallopoietes TaxID=37928 RepID=A0A1H0ZEI7_9MICC|nr:DUF1707 domain-containing protein [Arthrobacter crystallopoietes]AUI52030.1 hypothetical protein AC20117_15805 [Arthrobacter crystallopoietes]SDQ25576.1 hypothetical protein SAMN04489742_0292 [Arthrobacter crystallopoietes]
MNAEWFLVGGAWLFGLVLLMVVVLLAVMVVRAFVTATRGGQEPFLLHPAATHHAPPPRSVARQILDQRLAHGRITLDEYQERLRVLGESSNV